MEEIENYHSSIVIFRALECWGLVRVLEAQLAQILKERGLS